MRQILLPNRTRFVNFSNPLNGRMWLSQLVAHDRYGLLFKPNLDLPREVLGFTFGTNAHGLRGPANLRAPNVVLGTSFAMGLSVDNGSNWYDLLLDPDQWFNGGMPVGPANHLALLDERYEGAGDTLLYLYHPNLWKTATGFVEASAANRSIFTHLGWRVDKVSAVKTYLQWIPNEMARVSLKQSLYRDWGGQTYHFNPRYNFFDLSSNLDFIESQMDILNLIFTRFSKVLAVRVPIKEEIGVETGKNQRLDFLRQNYDDLWMFFKHNAIGTVRPFEIDRVLFGPADFHPYDTHWTAEGNHKVAEALRVIMRSSDAGGLIDARD